MGEGSDEPNQIVVCEHGMMFGSIDKKRSRGIEQYLIKRNER